MKLKPNQTYSRREISGMLGGSIQAYLPTKGGKVVCGCFRDEEEYNPGAPEVVLFGRERFMRDVEKAAEMVREQGRLGECVPIFIHRESKVWEYVGDYKCVDLSRDADLIRKKKEAHPGRGVLTGVLRFEKL